MDVDLSWYLAIGISLSNTMFINAFTMQLPFLASELVAKRALRYLQETSTKISQVHMNKVFAPSRFSIHSRMAMLVNTLVITFLFNTALPALVPFAAVAFTLAFLVDKVRLCRAKEKGNAWTLLMFELVVILIYSRTIHSFSILISPFPLLHSPHRHTNHI